MREELSRWIRGGRVRVPVGRMKENTPDWPKRSFGVGDGLQRGVEGEERNQDTN